MAASLKANAWDALHALSAPPRLVRHAELVLEAAEMLTDRLVDQGIQFNEEFVHAGAIIHDAGKAVFPAELDGPGNRHEEEGPNLLLAQGLPPALARVAQSHAQWHSMECSLDELLIALSDKLWKGKRVDELENRVVELVASESDREKWSVYSFLDAVFEDIADGGPDRLSRSRIA